MLVNRQAQLGHTSVFYSIAKQTAFPSERKKEKQRGQTAQEIVVTFLKFQFFSTISRSAWPVSAETPILPPKIEVKLKDAEADYDLF